jgi:hypothetical protein
MDPGYSKKISLKNSLFLMRFFLNGKTANLLSNQTISYQQVNLINVNISELNFRHSSKIIEEIDYNRLDSNGYILDEVGRFHLPNLYNDEFETISAKIFDVFAYIHSRWFYFKIALITIGSIILLLIITIIIFKIVGCCRKCKSNVKKNEEKTREKKENVKSVNMIKSFLVKPKEVNSIEVRRHSTDSCCFDPATNSLLERIEKQNFELYKKAQQNNS